MFIAERNVQLDESSFNSPEPTCSLLVVFVVALLFCCCYREKSHVLIGPSSFVYILKQRTYAAKHCICIK